MKKLNFENINLFLLSVLPISIVLGSTISLITIFLMCIMCIYFIFIQKSIRYLLFDKTIILFFIIYIYLLFNSFISLDIQSGLARNLGFIRFIFLFIIINYIFRIEKNQKIIFKNWFLIIILILFDAFIEIFSGRNILGYGELYGNRIVSFFKDEPVLASFLNGFIFILSGYLLTNFKNQNIYYKIFSAVTVILFILCVVLTGERSNTLKLLFGIVLFFSINKYFGTKIKTYFIITLLSVVIFTISSSDYLKLRFVTQVKNSVLAAEAQEQVYFNLYKSGFEVFKNFPVFGVGNKNYRVETCNIEKLIKYENYSCNTHPHQIYFEFLSEHGILGSIILLSIFFYLIFRHIRVIIFSKNLPQLGSFVYLITIFLPLLPSGAFFNDFNSTLFWINLSILYSLNSKTNIFRKSQ